MPGRFPPGILCLLLVVRIAFPAEPQVVRLDVPYIAQEKNGCGAASIAMIMGYWHRQLGESRTPDVQTIYRALYSPDARGVYASDMQRYFRAHGFRTFAFKGEWIDLTHHLQKGRPLIVALKPGRNDLHYVVAMGFDGPNDLVMTHDPAAGKLVRQRRTEFENQWRGADNWSLLALPESQSSAR
jgi:ABC-type bacteriocin/lantibiotic exporter with double-glycine peptidase domain